MSLPAGAERDYFLAYPPLQPKQQIADFVASKGILVPPRFDTLADALTSNKSFIVRSEHPQDYAGSSGVLNSVFIRPQDCLGNDAYEPLPSNLNRYYTYRTVDMMRVVDEIDFLPQQEFEAKLTNLSSDEVALHCRLTGMDVAEFSKDISYSYWEGLGGTNHAMVVDNTVEGRYHLFTDVYGPERGVMFLESHGYQVFENGQVVHRGGSKKFQPEKVSPIVALIEFYESIRSLDKFDTNHCPVIEFQSVDDKLFFLQYHRTQDRRPTNFTLTRDLMDGEIPALFVRGATPPEGLELQLAIHYSTNQPDKRMPSGIDWNSNPVFTEALIRQRRLQLLAFHNLRHLLTADPGHLQRSQLFKPEVSMVIPYEDWGRSIKRDEKYDRVTNPIPNVNIHVVSDGRQGYIRRI